MGHSGACVEFSVCPLSASVCLNCSTLLNGVPASHGGQHFWRTRCDMRGNGVKRTKQFPRPLEVDYSAARAQAIRWLGDRYLLAKPINRRGLNLATHSGAQALEQRIRAAADAVCKEIGREHPDSTPSDKECAKAAADRGMVKARELILAAEAAQKKTGWQPLSSRSQEGAFSRCISGSGGLLPIDLPAVRLCSGLDREEPD